MKPDNMSNSLSLSFRSLKAVAAMGVAMTLTSLVVGCTDDFMPERTSSGREIRFNMMVDNGEWQSRADGGEPETEYVGVYPLDGTADGDSLFLHVQVIKGIQPEETEEIPMDSSEFQPSSRTSIAQSMKDVESMGVFGSAYFGEWDESTCCVDYMYNVKYTPLSDGETWGADMTCFWLKDRSFRFFAYAPCDNPALSFSLPDTPGIPMMYYTTVNPGTDPDLIIAAPVDADGASQTVPTLEFKHAITAVSIKLVDPDIASGELKQVHFRNYYKNAAIPMDGSVEWSDYSNVGSCGYNVNGCNVDKYINKSNVHLGYFMFLPQELPDSAMLELKYIEKWSGQSITLTADLGGQVWEPGTTVKYTISTSRILVEDYFYGQNGVFSSYEKWYPGDASAWGNVYSCSKVTIDGVSKYVPQPWTLDFVDDNGNVIPTPSFIDMSNSGNKMSAKGTTDITTGSYNRLLIYVKPFAQGTDEHTPALKSADSEFDYDLSTKNGNEPMTTSNCYVVNAAGTYRFPLVYGNAITNGEEVVRTYENLVNYNGDEIKSAYITTDIGSAPARALVVWQDVENLVTGVTLDGDYVKFTVNSSTIHQGNSIIGIKDANDNVIWSWHIWVTDYNPYCSDGFRLTKGSKQYRIASEYVGWCDIPCVYFKPRSFKVRLTQTNTGKQITGTFDQKSNIYSPGYSPMYQWGRKDPLQTQVFGPDWGDRFSEIKKYNYEAGKYPSTKIIKENIEYNNFILNPQIRYKIERWTDTHYNLPQNATDLWGADFKTIYDPSPRGYRVAPIDAYSGMTITSVISYQCWTIPLYPGNGSVLEDLNLMWTYWNRDFGYFNDDNDLTRIWCADYAGNYTAKYLEFGVNSSKITSSNVGILSAHPINAVMEDWFAQEMEDWENANAVEPEPDKGYYNRYGQWIPLDEYNDYFGATPDGDTWYPFCPQNYWQDDEGFWHEY